MANLAPVMKQNFIEYASYTIVERAFPDLRDGCKPVQRRILQTWSNQMTVVSTRLPTLWARP